MDEGAGNGDALLLAAGEGGREGLAAVAEADQFEGGAGFGQSSAAAMALNQEWDGGILFDAETGDELELLEDEADGGGAAGGAGGSAERMPVFAEDFAVAGGGFEDAGNDGEQCGFAATGRADEHEELALFDFEIDAAQRLDGLGWGGI